jgi:hypothetical protein
MMKVRSLHPTKIMLHVVLTSSIYMRNNAVCQTQNITR